MPRKVEGKVHLVNPPKISLTTLRMFQEYHWLMLRVFSDACIGNFGDEGVEILRRGAYSAGFYRGTRMSNQSALRLTERNAISLVESWDTGEWELAAIDGLLQWSGSGADLTITLPSAPGSDYFVENKLPAETLEVYWAALVAGIAAGFGSGCEAEIATNSSPNWSLRLKFPNAVQQTEPLNLGKVGVDEVALLEMSRRTSGLIAALQMYVSQELVRKYDAAGEEVVREASYRFGALRGGEIREKHLREGIALTLENFASKSGLQERDPSEAVFVFSDKQFVSDGAYYLDCTYCPLQEVWAHEGSEGLRLGYLFDAANHRGLFQSYHPETVIRWDSVKSRGDSVCKFRFTIPSLLIESDLTPEEFDKLDK